MSLLNFFTKKRPAPKGFQGQIPCVSSPLKAFILEPILTPSGLVDIEIPDPTVIDDLDVNWYDNINFAFDAAETVPDANNWEFESGYFTVGANGEVSIDFLFDGGGYQGELAIFNLEGIDAQPGSPEFIQIAATRALSNSPDGYVVIADPSEGAKFSAALGEQDWNYGEYQGVKTFEMTAGTRFGVMLIPNGTVEQVANGILDPDKLPLFSMASANPEYGLHIGQIADVTGDGSTFVMEDLRVDTGTDRDYNDIIFQVRGATGNAALMDDLIDPAHDWRDTDAGRELLAHITPADPIDYPPDCSEIGEPLPVDPLTGQEYKPGEILVKFKPDADINSIIQSHGAIASESIQESGEWQLLTFSPDTDLQQIRANLAQDSNIDSLELNYKLSVESADPLYSRLWGLNNTGQTGGRFDADIDAPEAWRIQSGSRSVTVAVIDSGVDYRHPDLAANIWRNVREIAGDGIDNDRNGFVDDIVGYDFANRDNNPMDDNGHGTHVAGTIGAVGNNSLGVIGVSPNVSIMPLKFLARDGSGFTMDGVRAVDYATRMGADVINASFGGGGYSQAMYDAISRANSAGVLFVAAAGNAANNNDWRPSFPANYDLPNVISVAATDHNDRLANFSNYGRNTVDLAAPGVNILSTLPGSRYGFLSGTSMAAPHVAGAAALLFAQNPNQSVAQVKSKLLNSVDRVAALGSTTLTGGRLNVYNALAMGNPPPPAINWVNFNGWVGPRQGINLRYSRQFSDRSPFNEPYGKTLQFDAWAYGEVGTDMWLGTPDARWFKIKGRNLWVPSAWIYGNPPNSRPMP